MCNTVSLCALSRLVLELGLSVDRCTVLGLLFILVHRHYTVMVDWDKAE